MVNLDSTTNDNNKKHNEKWPYISDQPARILKTNALINFINEQNDIDKIYLYARDLSKPKYQYLIKKREDARTKHLNNPFIECSNTMDYVILIIIIINENINDYNPIRKKKKLIVY